jgi:transcriptional regulator with XRE-family HTH domain
MKPWYEKARDLMARQDIKVYELADTLGMTPGGAGHYLAGRRHPKPGMLRKIAQRLGVSVSELIEDDPSFARDEDEHQALELMRQIPQEQHQAALAMLRGLAQAPPADQTATHDPPTKYPSAA